MDGENEYEKTFELKGETHKVDGYPIYFFNGKNHYKPDGPHPDKGKILTNIRKLLTEHFEDGKSIYLCYHPGHK